MALSFIFGGIFGKNATEEPLIKYQSQKEEVTLLTKEDFQQFSLAFF